MQNDTVPMKFPLPPHGFSNSTERWTTHTGEKGICQTLDWSPVPGHGKVLARSTLTTGSDCGGDHTESFDALRSLVHLYDLFSQGERWPLFLRNEPREKEMLIKPWISYRMEARGTKGVQGIFTMTFTELLLWSIKYCFCVQDIVLLHS